MPEASSVPNASLLVVLSATTTAGLLFAISALAKPVSPRTPAPVATTRPAATATLVKRELIFIVLYSLNGGVHQVFLAETTFTLVGKEYL